MSDADIDAFFKELQLKEDVDNFIKYNKKPVYAKSNAQFQYGLSKHLYPLMEDYISSPIPPNNIHIAEEKKYIRSSIQKCDEFIKMLNTAPPEIETCPVCMTELEETNYVVPRCNHKVCTTCFANNIKHNKHTGDCCVLCRKRIC